MKNIIAFLVVFIIGMNCFCQQIESLHSIQKTDYLQKSKNQKTAAWLLLSGGIAMTVTGMVIYQNAYNSAVEDNPWYFGTDANPAGAVIATVGLLSCAGSIPLFIASGKNKKRARAV